MESSMDIKVNSLKEKDMVINQSKSDSILKKKLKQKGLIRVVLRSSDGAVLDEVAKGLATAAKRIVGASGVIGPVPLPKKRKVWTVLTSPHIDKKARQQLQRFVKSRLIEFASSKDVMDMLDGNCSIPASVEINIKT